MSSSPIKKWVDLLSTTKICGICWQAIKGENYKHITHFDCCEKCFVTLTRCDKCGSYVESEYFLQVGDKNLCHRCSGSGLPMWNKDELWKRRLMRKD